MGFIEDIQNGKFNLVFYIVIVVLFFYLYSSKNRENFGSGNSDPDLVSLKDLTPDQKVNVRKFLLQSYVLDVTNIQDIIKYINDLKTNGN